MGFLGWFVWFLLCGGFLFGVCLGFFFPSPLFQHSLFPALESLALQQTSVRALAAVGPLEPSQQTDGQRRVWSCLQGGAAGNWTLSVLWE